MAKVSLRAYNREIEAMIDRGHLDEAIAHCQHILKTFPKHLETYRLLAKSYLEAKRYGEAVDIFSRVLVAEPSDFVAQVGMSIIRDEQNKLDDAIWHMERAFETQPSNAAIQGELQRLYGRRDGAQPPRIRMTRGALAHMYMQGELYPQAISETKSVLKEDGGRTDMQALLAKAYFKSGQKNDAADTASAALHRYPYCLDANRVLTEILSIDRPESADTYRRRVFELDPYAAQVDGSVFESDGVSDAAVTLERLDWNGQPVGMSSDWGSTSAISLESGEQPDWLKSGLDESSDAPPSTPAFVSEQEASSQPDAELPAQPQDDIPDFMRAAGWGESTGAFDESKSSAMFDDKPASDAQPLEQADMPDWVKAMAPQQATEPTEADEDIPDWISKIGTDELPIPSAESSSEDQPAWLTQADDTSEQEADTTAGETIAESDDQLDWLTHMDDDTESGQTTSSSDDGMDFLSQLGGKDETATAYEAAGDTDFFNSDETEQPEPEVASSKERSYMPDEAGNLGMGEDEQDDSFAWLENLAAKQGATEGLLTKPEDRLEEEPDWIKQAKGLSKSDEGSASETPAASAVPPGNTDDLGKSETERDDSFAWLENLAAKQGATEGLLTKPEERREDEPEWVKQAKSSAETTTSPAPTSDTEEPKIPQEDMDLIDEAREIGENFFDESISVIEQEEDEQTAETAATVEGVTDWRDGLEDEREEPAYQAASDSTYDSAAWLRELEKEEEQPEEQEVFDPAVDTAAWLEALDKPDKEPVATESNVPEKDAAESPDELPGWLEGLDEDDAKTPAVPTPDDLPAWMQDETGELVAEPTKIEPTQSTDWTPDDDKKAETEEEDAPPPAAPKPAAVSVTEEPEPASKPEPVKKPAPKKTEVKSAAPPAPNKEPVTRRATGMLEMPVDPVLGSARAELTRSNIPGALETYGQLIKKGRFLEEVIFDLRDALYRYPVEVSIWQSLGDAYMRANQLQDALDAYTKAEELLR